MENIYKSHDASEGQDRGRQPGKTLDVLRATSRGGKTHQDFRIDSVDSRRLTYGDGAYVLSQPENMSHKYPLERNHVKYAAEAILRKGQSSYTSHATGWTFRRVQEYAAEASQSNPPVGGYSEASQAPQEYAAEASQSNPPVGGYSEASQSNPPAGEYGEANPSRITSDEYNPYEWTQVKVQGGFYMRKTDDPWGRWGDEE